MFLLALNTYTLKRLFFFKALHWKHASDTSVYFWIQFEGKQLYIKSKLFISAEIS